jgi:hypothetical protein
MHALSCIGVLYLSISAAAEAAAQISRQHSQTILPTQSLFMLNNDLFCKRANALVNQLIIASPQTTLQPGFAYANFGSPRSQMVAWVATGRPPAAFTTAIWVTSTTTWLC